jgi:glycosyltransferase involved in cell wall biosynthesis
MPEVVIDGETGYVVPPNDPATLGAAISRLLDDKTAAGEMGARGRARAVDYFSWPRVVDRCLSAYRLSTETGTPAGVSRGRD